MREEKNVSFVLRVLAGKADTFVATSSDACKRMRLLLCSVFSESADSRQSAWWPLTFFLVVTLYSYTILHTHFLRISQGALYSLDIIGAWIS